MRALCCSVKLHWCVSKLNSSREVVCLGRERKALWVYMYIVHFVHLQNAQHTRAVECINYAYTLMHQCIKDSFDVWHLNDSILKFFFVISTFLYHISAFSMFAIYTCTIYCYVALFYCHVYWRGDCYASTCGSNEINYLIRCQLVASFSM